jgi:hypothetical protein
MRIPDGLNWWRETPGGAAWLERLPEIVGACCERWHLALGTPYEPASVSFVASATREDGSRAVLKVNIPEPESEHEADALAHWAGVSAVGLLEHDRHGRALLVERCEPGTQLWAIADEEVANTIAAGILRRLWRPPPARHPFRLLSDEAERWIEEIPEDWEQHGRPFERALVDLGVSALEELGPARTSGSSSTRTSTAATFSSLGRRGSQSTRSRWSASGSSTPRRYCAIAVSRLIRHPSGVSAAASTSSRTSSPSTVSGCVSGALRTLSPGEPPPVVGSPIWSSTPGSWPPPASSSGCGSA